MRFRLGYVAGFATGYYLGAKAGHQRYDQINKQLKKLRRSPAFETVTGKARAVLDGGLDKAKDLAKDRLPLPRRSNGSHASGDGSSKGTNTIPAAAPLTGQPTAAPPTAATPGSATPTAATPGSAPPTAATPKTPPPYSSSK